MMSRQDTHGTDMSPLEIVRHSLGLTRGELALLAGCGHGALYNAEMGSSGQASIPSRVTAALEGLGVDVDALASEQAAWLRARAAEVREKAQARVEQH
jgi:hypothetical protein